MSDYLKVNTLEEEEEEEKAEEKEEEDEKDLFNQSSSSSSSTSSSKNNSIPSNRNQHNVLISKPPSQPRDVTYSSIYLLVFLAMVCFTVFKREEPLSNAIVSTKYAGS